MSSVVLWSLSLVTSPVLLGFGPATASVRAAEDAEPRRRSHDEQQQGAPRIQMGAGPTALAMVALLVAVVGRSLRRRRIEPHTTR